MPNVVLKNRYGEPTTYSNVNQVVLKDEENNDVFYNLGEGYTGGETDTIVVNVDTTYEITADLKDMVITATGSENQRSISLDLKNYYSYFLSGFTSITINDINDGSHLTAHLFVTTPDIDGFTIIFPVDWTYSGTSMSYLGRNQSWEFSIDTTGGVLGYMKT